MRAGSEAGAAAGAEHKVVGVEQARSTKLHQWVGNKRGAGGEAEHEAHPWAGSRRGARDEAEHEAASISALRVSS